MSDSSRSTLSPEGVARRDSILDALSEEMDRIHRHRAGRRIAVTTATLSLLITAAIVLVNVLESPSTVGESIVATRAANSETPDAHSVVFVETDPSVISRWIVDEPTADVEVVDDEALLELLAQMERPTGLIRWDSQVWLTNPIMENVNNNPPKDDSESSAVRNDVET